MLEGMFLFVGTFGPVWIDLSSVDAFICSGTRKTEKNGTDVCSFDVLFRNGRSTTIYATAQELNEIVKQHRTDRSCLETLASKK